VADDVRRGEQSSLSNGLPSQNSWQAQGFDQNHSWPRLPACIGLAGRKSNRRLEPFALGWGRGTFPQLPANTGLPQTVLFQCWSNSSGHGALPHGSAT
jgi:hypothetical protein